MNIWTITWFELKRLTRTRIVMLNQFLLPMILIFILGSALSNLYSTTEKLDIDPIHMMIIDQTSEGSLAELGWNQFKDSSDVKQQLVIMEGKDKQEAIRELKEGKIDLAAVVPSDFRTAIMKGESSSWEIIEGKSAPKNQIGKMMLDTYLSGLNLMQAGVQSGGTDGADFTYVQMESLSNGGNKYSSFEIYASSMLIMFLLYSGLTVSISLQSEQQNKTLYRLQGMPVTPLTIFMGKILGNSLVAGLQAVVIIVGTHLLYGVNWGSHLVYLIIICMLVITFSMLMGTVITLLVKSYVSTSVIIQSLIVAMTFVSGGFRPINNEVINTIGQFSVNHYATQSIMNIMLAGDMSKVMHSISMLGMYSAVILVVGIVVYRKVGYHE